MKNILIILCTVLLLQNSCCDPAIKPAPRILFDLISDVLNFAWTLPQAVSALILTAFGNAILSSQGTLDEILHTVQTAQNDVQQMHSPTFDNGLDAFVQAASSISNLGNVQTALNNNNRIAAAANIKALFENAMNALGSTMDKTAELDPATASDMEEQYEALKTLKDRIISNVVAAGNFFTLTPKSLKNILGNQPVQQMQQFISASPVFLKSHCEIFFNAVQNRPSSTFIIDFNVIPQEIATTNLINYFNQAIAIPRAAVTTAIAGLSANPQFLLSSNPAITAKLADASDFFNENNPVEAIQNLFLNIQDLITRFINGLQGLQSFEIKLAADTVNKLGVQAEIVLRGITVCGTIGAQAIQEHVNAINGIIACESNPSSCDDSEVADFEGQLEKLKEDYDKMRMCIIQHGAEFLVIGSLSISGFLGNPLGE